MQYLGMSPGAELYGDMALSRTLVNTRPWGNKIPAYKQYKMDLGHIIPVYQDRLCVIASKRNCDGDPTPSNRSEMC